MGVRQRLEQQGAGDGENGAVRTDAQRQSENGDGGEAGGFAQRAQSVFEVLRQRAYASPRDVRKLRVDSLESKTRGVKR